MWLGALSQPRASPLAVRTAGEEYKGKQRQGNTVWPRDLAFILNATRLSVS